MDGLGFAVAVALVSPMVRVSFEETNKCVNPDLVQRDKSYLSPKYLLV